MVVLVLQDLGDDVVHLQVAVDIQHAISVHQCVHDVYLIEKPHQRLPRQAHFLYPTKFARRLLHACEQVTYTSV